MVKNEKNRLRVAIVGCGAVSEWQHLPALLSSNDVILTALVDKNPQRVESLAKNCPDIQIKTNDFHDLAGKVDCAVVALPHSLHCPVTIDLLDMGIHVLVEKPIALNTAECDRMIATSEKVERVLAVGHMRRFFPSSITVKNIIDSEIIGRIKKFDFQEGYPYNWPVTSISLFKSELSGGGVLIDTGPHILDQLQWWLGNISEIEYYDDNMGGVEADCLLNLKLYSGVSGTVTLSRIRQLRNTFTIEGENAKLEIEAAPLATTRLYGRKGELLLDAKQVEPKGYIDGYIDSTKTQLKAFVQACRGSYSKIVTGNEASKTIAIIERCYLSRKPLHQKWEHIEGLP
jgi:predicted dehydrogenase